MPTYHEYHQCRQCGFKIVQVPVWHRHWGTNKRGFCSVGCEQVYEELKQMALRAAKNNPF